MSKVKKAEKSYKEWTSFWKLYQEAYKVTGSQAQTKAAVIWNEIKNGDTNLTAEISKLNRIKIKRDSKTGLIWAGFSKPSETASSSSSSHPSSSSSTSPALHTCTKKCKEQDSPFSTDIEERAIKLYPKLKTCYDLPDNLDDKAILLKTPEKRERAWE